MTAPTREQREEWSREAQAGEYRHGKDCHWPMPCCCEATRILALLDALGAAEERLAAVRALCDNAKQHSGGSFTSHVDVLSIERAIAIGGEA